MQTANADHLEALAWLVDAGADEAVLDEPVNRFAAPKSVREPARAELPQRAPTEVRESFRPRAPQPTPAVAPAASDDAIGSAMEIAARAQTLAELKAALESYRRLRAESALPPTPSSPTARPITASC